MRAITTGSAISAKATVKVGRCQPTTLLAEPSFHVARSVAGGSPNHGAELTWDQSTRRCSVTLPAAGEYEVIGPMVRSSRKDRR